MLVFVFPGQGSQKKGMGAELFDRVPEYLEIEQDVDQLLGYSLRKLCLENEENKLTQTQYTQPCLYTVNALHGYQALAEGKKPAFLAGHSLGEYSALLFAGAFDFLTGLKLVKKRGELMSQATNGAMAAVVGLTADRIKPALQKAGINEVDVANFNSPTQTVIAGSTEDIQKAISVLDEAGAKMCIPLPVSAAFHSRFMANAGKEFGEFLGQFSFNALRIPVVANVTGDFYPIGDPNVSIRDLLTRQISESVQWVDSVNFLSKQGATEFTEMGPGVVLTGLIKQIKS